VGKNFAVLDIFFYGIFIETPIYNLFSNIKVDIWHPDVCLRCIIPPSYLSQLKTRAISLILAQSGQEHCRPWYIFNGIFIETSLHNFASNIKIDIWHTASGFRCIIPPRHLSQLKTRAIPLILAQSGQELCRPWYIFHGIFIEHLSQALKSGTRLGNTFDISPEWQRTLPSFVNFSWNMHRVPPNPNIKVDIWHPAVGLRCIIPPRHLSQIKTQAITLS
jgi:hypothetical protein